MNRKKKTEQYLYAAPKPQAPDGLLEKLNRDMASAEIKPQRSTVRRWFFPTGRSISLGRVAAAAAIALAILLPLSYGAAKVIKHFTISGIRVTVKNSDNINNEEDARKVLEEFGKLYREGKATEVEPGVWQVTLSSGEKFAYAGRNPEWVGLPDAERKKLLKKQSDEINELRKAGKYERTFLKEVEEDGVKTRLYRDRFTLSNGRVVTLTSGEEKVAKEEDNQ